MSVPKTNPVQEIHAPAFRLLEGRGTASESSFASLRAWILLFGSFSFAGGHGVFLFAALTRLERLPAATELGGPLETAVQLWFMAGIPLAILAVPLRGRFLRLTGRAGWTLATAASTLTLAAFAIYLNAIVSA